MIQINDNKDCCGCSACVQVCPKQCISFTADEQGFGYPRVESSLCINCGLCERVCPMLHAREKHEVLGVYAAKNRNESVRLRSSSGGVFFVLAESVIAEGGVVFGARWNKDWTVEHDFVEDIEGIKLFQGSKYIQSFIGNSYKKAEFFLKKGRKVLFSGTPCQISGLKIFLRKEYENLLTVECVCHSVPSPGVWKNYLKDFLRRQHKDKSDVEFINFRDKVSGWKGYSFAVTYKDGTRYIENKDQNLWMKGFIKGLYTRPSCSNCPSKSLYSDADITLGDFWGITQLAPHIDDDKGMCVLIVHSLKCKQLLHSLNIDVLMDFPLSEVIEKNPAIQYATKESPDRGLFFAKMKSNKSVSSVIKSFTREPFYLLVRRKVSSLVRLFIKKV